MAGSTSAIRWTDSSAEAEWARCTPASMARIGREVALKMVRREVVAEVEPRQRFLREARLQGQLEHPAVVPVYDLGMAPDGGVFFTMKRIGGDTLADILDGLADGESGPSQHKLLAWRRAIRAHPFVGDSLGGERAAQVEVARRARSHRSGRHRGDRR